ncbi:hypothetical protein BDV12DRAFT_14973 [Aspergillus spectabilis]
MVNSQCSPASLPDISSLRNLNPSKWQVVSDIRLAKSSLTQSTSSASHSIDGSAFRRGWSWIRKIILACPCASLRARAYLGVRPYAPERIFPLSYIALVGVIAAMARKWPSLELTRSSHLTLPPFSLLDAVFEDCALTCRTNPHQRSRRSTLDTLHVATAVVFAMASRLSLSHLLTGIVCGLLTIPYKSSHL